jgi:hypothetical protein
MTTPTTAQTPGGNKEGEVLKRRGLFAAAAGLVAAVVAKVTEQPVQAGTDGDVVLGATNTTPTQTVIVCSTPGGDAFTARADIRGGFSSGLKGFGPGFGTRTPTSFRVNAKDTASNGSFSWRIVAKRKDITASRFERVTVPQEPTLPRIADIPAAPRLTRTQPTRHR